MRTLSVWAFAILTIGMLVPAAFAEEERRLPEGVTVLSEEELRAKFVGSTATGISSTTRTAWTEYYQLDGRIRGVWGGSPYGGAWTISGPWMCFDYGGDEDDGCNTIVLDGDHIKFFEANGEPYGGSVTTLIPGEEAAPPPFQLGPINTGFWGDVAIMGYDPVAYFADGRPIKGAEEFSHEWLGATWHFASAEHRDLFAADPVKFAPQYGGYCSWGMTDGGIDSADPEAWRIVDGKLYLLFSKDALANWEQDIPGKIAAAEATWPTALESLTQ